MSLPIKGTPILRGKDAKKFTEKMNKAKSNPISKEEYERIHNICKKTIKNNIL